MRFGRHNKLPSACCYPSSLAPVYQHCKSAYLDVKHSPYEWAIHLLTLRRQSMWNVERLDTARVRDSSMQLKCEEHINHGFKWIHPNSRHARPPPPRQGGLGGVVTGPESDGGAGVWTVAWAQRWRWPAFPNGLWLRRQMMGRSDRWGRHSKIAQGSGVRSRGEMKQQYLNKTGVREAAMLI